MISKQQLAILSNDELRQVMNMIDELKTGRENQRRKELWGNVIAAISKYEDEMGQISVYCRECGSESCISSMDKNAPGYIEIC